MIIFETVTAKNFLGFGNEEMSVKINEHQMTLIDGKNGSGKSSILEAICFSLYGRAYREINKPLLVNSVNQKQCEVSITFSVGKKRYRVVRGIKPSKFEIYEDGVLINQDPHVKDYQKVLEQQILRMNFRAFTQIVVIGSGSYIPFMKLTTAHRREFIEDLLDIRVFSAMNALLKERAKTTKETIKNINTDLKLLMEKADLQKNFIAKQKRELIDAISSIEGEIHVLMGTIASINVKVAVRVSEVSVLLKGCEGFDGLDEEKSECSRAIKSMIKEITDLKKSIEWYESSEECFQCQQNIKSDHKSSIIKTLSNQALEKERILLTLVDTLSVLEKKYENWQKNLNEISILQRAISSFSNEIEISNKLVESKNQTIKNAQANTSSIDEEKKKLKEFAKEIVQLAKDKEVLLDEQQYEAAAGILLQDSGIKAKVIKQYIPIINSLSNKYLDQMDFFVQFNLDENFNEVVKSRHRDTFVYNSFSEGQKFRLNAALLLTWIYIAESKNSAACNLLFADELMDGALDQEGVDAFLDLLRQQKKKNIFIVSHREGLTDKFNNRITVSTSGNFSKLEFN